jgi:hypothetical protein
VSDELHQVEPREQVGAATGERYEFQYHQAAAGALEVLDDTKVACVYCEWHDDYVVESAGVAAYRFHQVKTRTASQGPWRLNEFFGIKRSTGRKSQNAPPSSKKKTKGTPAAPTVSADSIFGRLYDHVQKFGGRCEHFVFVTDAGVADNFTELLDAVRPLTDFSALSGDPAATFTVLRGALPLAFPSITPNEVFSFLQRLYVQEAVGKLADLKSCRTLLGGRIYELSEVDLTQSERQKIGDALVAVVREKSHRKLPTLPASTNELRLAKGLVLDDVLRVLSLSAAGYRELKSSGREGVVALSRLHRLCKRSGVADTLIPELCRLKTSWDAWWLRQRHNVNILDHVALKNECADAMRVHADGRMTFDGLRQEATALTTKYASVLTSSESLTRDLVFGLMLAVAVEAEP